MVILLIIIIVFLTIYTLYLLKQIRNVNKQLYKRLKEQTRQPISLELFNKDLNNLVSNINKCLKNEENTRLQCIREDKKLKEITSNVSHDLRTPLTAMKGYIQMLNEEILSRSQGEKLEIVMRHTEELERLINQFFEYSYIVSEESIPRLEKVNLTNIVAECIADLISIFEEKGIRVCHEQTLPIFILGDRDLVTRIIKNLLGNCAVHSNGNVNVTLVSRDDAVLSFENPIADDSEIEINQLFDRFYTGDKTRRGSGLGLSIVKFLTEQMGGSVGAYIENRVLCIKVELPLYK